MIDQTLDRREAILERLFAIGQGISGIGAVMRNPCPLPTPNAVSPLLGVERPAFLLFDGGARLTQDIATHKRPTMPVTIWSMTPQIIVLLESRDTFENILLDGQPSPIGPELSRWMMLLNGTITNDSTIIDLVTANGLLALSSIETDLRVGRAVGALGAWLMMLYEFRYPLFPTR